jgi:peptidylprolyl isomerase
MKIFALLFALLFSLQSFASLDDGLYAKMQTNRGEVLLKLTFEKTPLTVINFVGLATGQKKSNAKAGKPFYDGLKFHRVIDNFMVQGGDPKGTGAGGPGYQFIDELTDLKHDKAGTLSMANSGANTNGSQFFITHEPTPWLDGKHTVFGYVVKGMNVVNKIKKNDTIQSLKIIRIGKKAQNFKTDEKAFQAQKNTIATQIKAKNQHTKQAFQNFISKKYPKAVLDKNNYFSLALKTGKGKMPNTGDLVKVSLTIQAGDGTILRPTGEPVQFAAGMGRIIRVIDKSVLQMKTGEKRQLIVAYNEVYGSKKINNRKDEILIFTLELLSINQL